MPLTSEQQAIALSEYARLKSFSAVSHATKISLGKVTYFLGKQQGLTSRTIRPRMSAEQKRLAFELYPQFGNIKTLAAHLDCAEGSVGRLLRSAGVEIKKPKKSDPVEAELIINLYREHSSPDIGKIIGRSSTHVINVLRRNGIEPRNQHESGKIYNVNSDYFRNVDSTLKAYLLGYIYADGNVFGTRFKFAIGEVDKYLLEGMAKEVGFDGPIYHEPNDIVRYPNRSDMYALTIYNKGFVDNLKDKGVIENKTSALSFPKWIDPALVKSFLLGLFDGDGTVSHEIRKDKAFVAKCGFSGAPQMMLDVQQIFQNMGISGHFVVCKNRGRRVDFHGTHAIKALNYLYSGLPRLFLTRKYARYKDIVTTMSARMEKKETYTRDTLKIAQEIIFNNAA